MRIEEYNMKLYNEFVSKFQFCIHPPELASFSVNPATCCFRSVT